MPYINSTDTEESRLLNTVDGTQAHLQLPAVVALLSSVFHYQQVKDLLLPTVTYINHTVNPPTTSQTSAKQICLMLYNTKNYTSQPTLTKH